MNQQEIQFFWPLTEQIPLDLDYSQCAPHLYYIKAKGQPTDGPYATGMVYANGPTVFANTVFATPVVTIKADNLTIQTKHMPWYRKLAYKLMGFKWE